MGAQSLAQAAGLRTTPLVEVEGVLCVRHRSAPHSFVHLVHLARKTGRSARGVCLPCCFTHAREAPERERCYFARLIRERLEPEVFQGTLDLLAAHGEGATDDECILACVFFFAGMGMTYYQKVVGDLLEHGYFCVG